MLDVTFFNMNHWLKYIRFYFVWLIAFHIPVLLGKESDSSSAKYNYEPLVMSQNELANLSSDINMLKAKIAQLAMQVEQLNRDNNEIRLTLVKKTDENDEFITEPDLSSSLDELKQELIEHDAQQKLAIISEFTRSMEKLAAQTESALKALAGVIEAQPTSVPTIEFSNDYSREGVAYTVQSGDTLSNIAQLHGSTVRDIQNANHIAVPEKLQVGETLFIPKSSK
jgi:LysM repeat protein